MKPNIVFLYSEVADYFLAGVEELSQQAHVLIIRWPVNDEAPFDLQQEAHYTMHSKDELGDYSKILSTVKGFKPDLIVCSGWMDKEYIKLCKTLKNIRQIVAFDNHWTGTIKQRLAAAAAKKTVLKSFDGAWVPGQPQVAFAQKLGFNKKQIQEGFYCANTTLFSEDSKTSRAFKLEKGLPQKFLFVGRYVQHKGIYEMWQAFKEVHHLHPDWELWCVGTGEEFEQRVVSEGIKHFGFVQPKDFKAIIEQTGAFILPSHFEPWGVVVHEYAVSGFPLLLSSAVGASSKFLEHQKNGFLFESGSREGIKNAMLHFIELSEQEKIEQSKHSFKKGCSYTTSNWCEKVLSFID